MRLVEKAAKKKAVASKKERREEKKLTRQAILDLKPLSYWEKRVERWCNRYVILRDRHLHCVSCGTTKGPWNAGHYKTVGAHPELRFVLANIHKQCARPCNKDKSGNILEYRKGLLKKIGVDLVEWLEGPHEPARRTKADCQELEALFKRWVTELEALIEFEKGAA